MATLNSLEYASEVAVPTIKIPITNKGARDRTIVFSFATAAATPVANGDIILIGELPQGARLKSGFVTFGAMGASATLSVGYVGATTRYANAIDVSAAGTASFLNTAALNYLDTLAAQTLIYITAGGANYANSKSILGHITYFVD